jgi:hypothetical protein
MESKLIWFNEWDLKQLIKRLTTSLVAGTSPETIIMIMDIESRAFTPSETFSVFSPVVEWGVKNPTIVTTVIQVEGMISVKM